MTNNTTHNMNKCTQCKSPFQISNEDKAFYNKISPIFSGKKYQIPEPTLCPDCRLQRRMVWRNERSLYRRKCDSSGESIISWIAPDKPQKAYKKDIWWGDSWSALDFGRDFDFNRSFFEQLGELVKEVPWLDLLYDQSVNSEYVNFCYNNKDCYLIFASNKNESCYYSNSIVSSKDCMDCFQGFECELCYKCVDINNCYKCKYSKNCTNCSECIFCDNCKNCKNCFGCVNLVGKQYYFMNEQLEKEEYKKRISNLNLDSHKRVHEAREFFKKHRLKFPMRFAQIVNSENSTGDVLRNCKNAKEVFDTTDAEDCKWLFLCDSVKDCYDGSGCEDSELCYEVVVNGVPASRVAFSSYVWKNVHNMYYSVLSPSSNDCFGCMGIKKGKYCILNKQYTKEEYEKLVPQIIEQMISSGDWGKFFPKELSMFAYNESAAPEFMSLAEGQAAKLGFDWHEDKKDYQKQTCEVPDHIKDVSDDITNETLACNDCGKNYKIIIQELNFYRKYNLPIPCICPNCRYFKRIGLRNPYRLYDRECGKCQADIRTTYAPDKEEKVLCEKCYLEEVY